MKFFRLDLLTLLISLFIFNSCKNQDTVGLGINSSNQLSAGLVDTSTIIINTVPEDSVATSGALAKNPLAYFNDPQFGLSVSTLATNLNLPNSASYSLPSGTITIDSVRLVLKFADGFYGDSITSRYKINVYQLKTKYRSDTTYYSNKVWGDYSGNPLLGTLTFNSRTHDSIKVYNIISGAPDTLIKVAPQIRIPIDQQFINTNLFNANGTTLGSNSIFQNLVRGLYITLDKTGTTGPGGIFMIQPTDSLMVYYKTTNGTTIDTTSTALPLTSMAASIQHTYPTAIKTELANTTTSRNVFYLQGLAGLRAKIQLPNLLANLRNGLLKKDSDIVISRAELVVTPTAGSGIPYAPLPKISLYTLDLAHQRVEVPDASLLDTRALGVTVFGGFYSTTTANYHFIVTAFCQDLMTKKSVDYGTYIGPVDITNTSSVDIAATSQVGARTVAVGTDASSAYKIKLNIIYSKIRTTK